MAQHHASATMRQLAMWLISVSCLAPVSAQLLPASPSVPSSGWQHCSALRADPQARLRCFDQWAQQQPSARPDPSLHPDPATLAPDPPAAIKPSFAEPHNCKNPRFSELSRFWELEQGSNCGTLGIRGYKPISLAVLGSDSVNSQPDSPLPDHRAASALAFNTTEARLQLSVRTKIAEGLLTQGQPTRRDSLWFGYTQQSNWQVFSGDLSRPFRTTDHEPELIYIYPADLNLPAGWRLRYAGLALNHQSNGQPLPLSRSWNRSILMAGLEKNNTWRLQGKLWARLPEDAADDDNPDISNYIGRAELTGVWRANADHTLSLTLRHALRSRANGSAKLEWLYLLGDDAGERAGGQPSGLRLHTQLFSGFGDSLIDYNRRRTVISVGLSLVDW